LFGWRQSAIYADMCEVFGKLGLETHRYSIGRIDPFIDVAGFPVQMIKEAYDQNRIVTRAACLPWHSTPQRVKAVYFGKSPLELRVYDKLLELLEQQGTDGLERYRQLHGLQVVPEEVTRVEFQIRGEWLREKCHRWPGEMIIGQLPKIMKDLMTEWLRVCDTVDRRNTQRSPIAEWWKELTDCFTTIFKEGPPMRKPIEVPELDVKAALAQIRGLVGRVAGQKGKEFATTEEYFLFAARLMVAAPDGQPSQQLEAAHMFKLREAADRIKLATQQSKEAYLNAVEVLRREMEEPDATDFDWIKFQ
jgi:hypothetical protein